jgi:hypothetical protein
MGSKLTRQLVAIRAHITIGQEVIISHLINAKLL